MKCPHGYKSCKWKCDEKCLSNNKKDFILIRIINNLKERSIEKLGETKR